MNASEVHTPRRGAAILQTVARWVRRPAASHWLTSCVPPGRGGVGSRPEICGFATFLLGFFAGLFTLHAADFSTLEPLLQEHCVECHGAKEPEGGLVLETHADLLKGGESGPVLVPGKGGESLLVKVLEGNWGKTGKNQFMPPGKREKLKPEQIALFKAWIDAGAPAPKDNGVSRELVVPKIAPLGPPRRPVNALAYEPKARLIAVARPDAVELLHVDTRTVVRTLTGFRGAANAVSFSADGQFLFAGAGETSRGEIQQWRVADGVSVRTLGGHKEAVYALAITSDGQTLASGGYDYAIKVWNLADGLERTTITANQGAIMGLAFRPDGRVLASVGYDRTAKLYDATSGLRLETFGQALKELNAVAFSPDGRTLLTGGNDNRIRAYRLGPEGREGSNELLATVFAHEGAILRLAFSPDGKTVGSSADDRTVKLFDAAELKPRLTLEPQPDWPTALVFAGDGLLAVGRADGSLAFYNPADGKIAPPPKPELIRTEPRGVSRGTATRLNLVGRNLEQATVVSIYSGGRLRVALTPERVPGGLGLVLEPPDSEPRGAWEISAGDGTVESARVKVWVDDLPQRELAARANPVGAAQKEIPMVEWPASVWSVLDPPGAALEFAVAAKAGQTLVFDLAGQSLGAKGDFALALLDASGRTVAENDSFAGQPDPVLIHRVAADGTFRLRVTETTFGGSPEHFFRVSVGELPFVTGLLPLSLPALQDVEVELTGVNLPGDGKFHMKTEGAGELALPVPAKSWRARRDWKFLVADLPAPREVEPNDDPEHANRVPVPVSVNGILDRNRASTNPPPAATDADWFRFVARRGVVYVIETAAATRGSHADTRIEVFWPDRRPVERVRLQALRNSAITFRPETSDDSGIRFENWEEMELNDLLWCGGEVMKIFRAPQGPDSDTVLYTANGRRRGYYDTTPMAHYLDEPVYLVIPLAAGERPVPNGLPLFTVNYVNEDASRGDVGTDSRILFTAPADGEFLVRVTDAREFGGREFGYRLVIREARPDFAVTLSGANATVAAGSGQGFTVTVNRLDGFEAPVEVTLNRLPPGWTAPSPLVIEAGHETAFGTLHAGTNAAAASDADWDAVTVVASAKVDGRAVAMRMNNLGRPRLAKESPKLLVKLEPVTQGSTNAPGGDGVVTIAPGGTAQARLSLVRNGFDGVVTFSVDNLPHGVIVENLGLNGITFLAGENEREISLAAAKWVSELDRPFHAVENQAGRQTSQPLILQVRRKELQTTAR